MQERLLGTTAIVLFEVLPKMLDSVYGNDCDAFKILKDFKG